MSLVRDLLRWVIPWKAASTATLLSSQKILTGARPVVTLTIGSAVLDAYIMGYKYEQAAQDPGGLSLWLDNREGVFDDLATDWPDVKRGAAVDLFRGMVVNDANLTAELPRCWIDSFQYIEDNGAGMLLVECVDWWGRLQSYRYASTTTWTGVNVKTILAALVANVGLTLDSGSFGYNTDYEIDVRQDLDEGVLELMARVDEFLYPGLDGVIKWKTLPYDEAAGYDYDFSTGGGAKHPLMPETEICESSTRYNKITVSSQDLYSGTAEDTTESALVGTRLYTLVDDALASNAQCLEAAQSELAHWQAHKIAATLVARPHFTLSMYDVVSAEAPPWGGPAVTAGRVTEIVERYGWGKWEQEITLGDLPDQAILARAAKPDHAASKASQKRARRSSSQVGKSKVAKRSHTHGPGGLVAGSVTTSKLRDGSVTAAKLKDGACLAEILDDDGAGSGLDSDLLDGVHLAAIVPSGVILLWSGAVITIPTGWLLCDGANGTPDLRERFIMGAGTTAPGVTGGASTDDLSHAHAVGTLAVGAHTHADGTLAADSDSHSHADGTLATADDAHTHGAGSLVTGANSESSLRDRSDGDTNGPVPGHTHNVVSGSTASDTHNHTVSGSTASDAHAHTVSGATASTAPTLSGATASAGSATHENRPAYYALCYIMKT